MLSEYSIIQTCLKVFPGLLHSRMLNERGWMKRKGKPTSEDLIWINCHSEWVILKWECFTLSSNGEVNKDLRLAQYQRIYIFKDVKVVSKAQDGKISHCLCKEICLKFIPKVAFKVKNSSDSFEGKAGDKILASKKYIYGWPLKMFGKIHGCHQLYNSR